MKKLFYPVVFHPEDIGYSVTVPDIDGCFTQGDTFEEAVTMAQDAIGLMLEDYFAEKKELPAPSIPSAITMESGDFIVMIEFDEVAYRKRNNPKSIKKTLTVPGWLNALAEENNINFSQLLQDALKDKLHIS